MKVRITHIEDACHNIKLFELRHPEQAALPTFAAGAHIDVTLQNGLTRQYSLCNSPTDSHRYLIGVLKDAASRGGSQYMHDSLHLDAELTISSPRNLFATVIGHHQAVLIAGGIGITPLMAMGEYFLAQNMPFSLVYFAKSPEHIAFKNRLSQPDFADKVTYVFGANKSPTTFSDYLGPPQNDKHVYTCGPLGFMQALTQNALNLGWSETNLHQELFQSEQNNEDNQPFEVVIASTQEVISVSADTSVAQALEDKGYFIPVSCEQGICGTCLTHIVSGTPEHRDHFLTDEEKSSNALFTPCCSRAQSPRLVLDL
ncbi:MAG: oxidoreductase [Neisseriaceae bacterium]|nr:oxidoreductase [Neisseriaceae bacterium]